MQAAILAGGLGTRLRPLTDTVPKAMVPVKGRPFLEYELELLRGRGVDEVVLCVGYLGDLIESHFGDGSGFGLKIVYSHDGEAPLGPIGGLKMAEKLLRPEFFVVYGDAYLRVDYRGLMRALLRGTGLGAMAVYRNDGSLGKRDVVVEGGLVAAYDKKRTLPRMEWTNFGVTALRKEALSGLKAGAFADEEGFYNGLLKRGKLLAFETYERFYEIGSEKSLNEFREFVVRGVESRSLPPGGVPR